MGRALEGGPEEGIRKKDIGSQMWRKGFFSVGSISGRFDIATFRAPKDVPRAWGLYGIS